MLGKTRPFVCCCDKLKSLDNVFSSCLINYFAGKSYGDRLVSMFNNW